jgi:hypothetical protein
MVTSGEASRLTGLGKTTLARATEADRLSAIRTTTSSIEPAEPAPGDPLKAPAEATDATIAAAGPLLWVHRTSGTRDATAATAALEAQVAGLRDVCDLLRRQLDEVREDRERWRLQAEAVQRLITDTDHRRQFDKVRKHREQWRSEAAQRPITGFGQHHRPWWCAIAGREAVKLITLLGGIMLMLAIIADMLK